MKAVSHIYNFFMLSSLYSVRLNFVSVEAHILLSISVKSIEPFVRLSILHNVDIGQPIGQPIHILEYGLRE